MVIEIVRGINEALDKQVIDLIKASEKDLKNNVCKNCIGESAGLQIDTDDLAEEFFNNLCEGECVTIKDNNEFTGIISYSKCFNKERITNDFEILVKAILVHPKYRRNGYGTILLKTIEDMYNYTKITVMNCSKNKETKEFLINNEFSRVKTDSCVHKECCYTCTYEKYNKNTSLDTQ